LVSFTQYMWRIFRTQSTKISTVEKLYQLPHNFFLLFCIKSLAKAPALFLLALSTWLVPIATIYPPGALTIASTPFSSNEQMVVPSYDPNYSIITLNPDPLNNHVTKNLSQNHTSPIAPLYYDRITGINLNITGYSFAGNAYNYSLSGEGWLYELVVSCGSLL